MTVAVEQIVINGAPSQFSRRMAALEDGYVQVDGRSFLTLLNFAVQFGRLINFYNLADQIDGDWQDFFLTDPTMILASLAVVDIAEIHAEYAALEAKALSQRNFNRKFELLRQLFESILDLARKINSLLPVSDQCYRSLTIRLLREEINAAIKKSLSSQLQLLKSYAEGAALPGALGRSLNLDFSGFLPIWDLGTICPDGSIYRGRTNDRKIDHAIPFLNPIFHSFLTEITSLKQFAILNLPETLQERDHRPQIALYIAFVTLFKTAQDTINTFSSRYIDFYYHDILRESRRDAVPDNVYLIFELVEDEKVLNATVPLATLFSAGKDADGKDLVYAADKELYVTKAAVAKLNTLRVISGPLMSGAPTGPSEKPVVQQVLQSDISVDVQTAEAAGKATASEQFSWVTFGKPQVGTTKSEVTTLATLGFAIASSYLLLIGGARTITVTIAFQSEKLLAELTEISDKTKLTREQILQAVLTNAFKVYLSTAAGWLGVAAQEIASTTISDTGESSFQIVIDLDSSAPAIEGCDADSIAAADGSDAAKLVTKDPTVKASNPAPSVPTLKAYLIQDQVILAGAETSETVYRLSLLDEIIIKSIQLDVAVKGLSNVHIENTDGPVDTSTPFTVFGAVPVQGSYMTISHTELFRKTLQSIDLEFAWFNLPLLTDGFKGYYQYYVIGPDGKITPDLFNNETFQVGFSVLNPGYWFLSTWPKNGTFFVNKTPDCPSTIPPNVPSPMYRTYDESTRKCIGPEAEKPLCQSTDFDKLKVCPTTTTLPPYYDPANSSIKMELILPTYAFGNSLYSKNVLNSVIEDLPDTGKCQAKCLTECAPLKQAVSLVKKCIASCASKSADEYLECLKECLKDSPDALQCLDDCNTQCTGKTGDEYKQCLSDCLKKCISKKYKDCVQICMNDCMSLKKELRYPNEPYLPMASSLTVSYKANCSVTAGAPAGDCLQFFNLMPFGGYSTVNTATGNWPLLPQFPSAGALYIGFTGVVSAQSLPMLFQMAATGSTIDSSNPDTIVWSTLSDNTWNEIRVWQIPSGPTAGSQDTGWLQNSSVLGFGLPDANSARNTILSSDYVWVQAATELPDQYPETIGIYPHVLTATWQNMDNSGAHLAQPLPAHTIKSSVQDLPNIGSIDQPMASFGGRAPESGKTFYTYMGERLRHKDRAILSWDYERLVLEQFPTVWKVQALPARNPGGGDVPGDVLLAVVPGSHNTDIMDSTAPLASNDLLSQIRIYLQNLNSPFIKLYVVNPNYVRITVTAKVLFRDDLDAGACLKQLNTDLIEYLSPWFYDAARAAKGGEYASESDISEFVQNRDYVEALIDITFKYDPERTSLEWYFLTSAKEHKIIDASINP